MCKGHGIILIDTQKHKSNTAEIRLSLSKEFYLDEFTETDSTCFRTAFIFFGKFTKRDYEACTEVSTWKIENIELDALCYSHVFLLSDECVFHVDGNVNKSNERIWVFRENGRHIDNRMLKLKHLGVPKDFAKFILSQFHPFDIL